MFFNTCGVKGTVEYMETFKNFYLTVLLCIIFKDVDRASAKSFQFKMNNDTSCRKGLLSTPWKAHSTLSCIVECRTRFQGRCTNVVFNSQTQTCSPVHPMSRDDPIIPSDAGDVLYSLDVEEDLFLACENSAGFQYHQKCGAAVCVMPFNVTDNYSNATTECQARNAVMYVPNTYERFALLEAISPRYTWAGLYKQDGVWVWDNGDPVDPKFYDFIWSYGQPNGVLEDCGALTYDVHLDKLHDWPCTAEHRYVCEFIPVSQNVFTFS